MSDLAPIIALKPPEALAISVVLLVLSLWKWGPKILPRMFGSERRGEPRGPLLRRVEAIEENMREQADRLTKVETETSYLRADVRKLENKVDDSRKEISGKIDNIQNLLLQHFVNGNPR